MSSDKRKQYRLPAGYLGWISPRFSVSGSRGLVDSFVLLITLVLLVYAWVDISFTLNVFCVRLIGDISKILLVGRIRKEAF